MFPAPEDCLNDLSPITSLFYVEQWLYGLLAQWVVESDTATTEPIEVQEQVAKVLETISTAAGMLDAACALMGVLPPEVDDK